MSFKVCVLMSTYNGEKYLREQVDSIFNQSDVDVEILVRDDCSTDDTNGILTEYENKCRLHRLVGTENLGPARSFMELVYATGDYDFYAFADQDDIWKPEKLKIAVAKLKNFTEPALYCSNQTLYENGEENGVRYNSEPNYTLAGCICGNSIAGCTMVFNKTLRDVLRLHHPSDDVLLTRMHDTWVISVAQCFGNVIYDSNSYIDYRIHSNNAVGIKKKTVRGRIQKLIKISRNASQRKGRSMVAKELIGFGLPMKSDSEKIVKCIAEYDRDISHKLKLIKNREIVTNCKDCRLALYIKILLGLI